MSETENNLEDRDNHLNEQLKNHPAEESIQLLVQDAKRRTVQLRLLSIMTVLTLLLGIGLTIASFKLYHLTELSQSTREAVVANCETSNESRKNQRELWAYVISLTPSEPRTEEQTTRVNKFSDFVDKTFAQRDCQAEAKNIQ